MLFCSYEYHILVYSLYIISYMIFIYCTSGFDWYSTVKTRTNVHRSTPLLDLGRHCWRTTDYIVTGPVSSQRVIQVRGKM